MVSEVFIMLMYADNTTIYYNIDQNISDEVINNHYQRLVNGLHAANKLSLNMTKTKCMFFLFT